MPRYQMILLFGITLCSSFKIAKMRTVLSAVNCSDSIDAWKCKNDYCISINKLCDGIKDCNDSSDETIESCKNTICTPISFRCDYGACISSERFCDGVPDCVDSSDEDSESCRKRREEVLPDDVDDETKRLNCAGWGQMKCWSGQCINATGKCNGRRDCDDGSDESGSLCKTMHCTRKQFQCKYGACIELTAMCNRTAECWDGSDENAKLCEGSMVAMGTQTTTLKSTFISSTIKPTTTIANPILETPIAAAESDENAALGGGNKEIMETQTTTLKSPPISNGINATTTITPIQVTSVDNADYYDSAELYGGSKEIMETQTTTLKSPPISNGINATTTIANPILETPITAAESDENAALGGGDKEIMETQTITLKSPPISNGINATTTITPILVTPVDNADYYESAELCGGSKEIMETQTTTLKSPPITNATKPTTTIAPGLEIPIDAEKSKIDSFDIRANEEKIVAEASAKKMNTTTPIIYSNTDYINKASSKFNDKPSNTSQYPNENTQSNPHPLNEKTEGDLPISTPPLSIDVSANQAPTFNNTPNVEKGTPNIEYSEKEAPKSVNLSANQTKLFDKVATLIPSDEDSKTRKTNYSNTSVKGAWQNVGHPSSTVPYNNNIGKMSTTTKFQLPSLTNPSTTTNNPKRFYSASSRLATKPPHSTPKSVSLTAPGCEVDFLSACATGLNCFYKHPNATFQTLISDHFSERIVEENSQIEFHCDKGYEVNGAGSTTCIANRWTEAVPNCRKIPNFCDINYLNDCRYPLICERYDPVLREVVEINQQNKAKERVTIYYQLEFSCEDDYVLEGAQSLTCGASSSWDSVMPKCVKPCLAELLPKCVRPLICSALNTKTLYSKQITTPTKGACGRNIQVNFSCEQGYLLKGANRTTCESYGWSHQRDDEFPECYPACDPDLLLKCKYPLICRYWRAGSRYLLIIRNGFYETWVKNKSLVGVTCAEGYERRGESQLTCKPTGWNYDLPKCDRL